MIDALSPQILSIFVLLIGLVLGSFGNVLIYRLPRQENLGGRSHCPRCQERIAVLDLIPVLGFCLLCGRCRHCRKPISIQYPLVECASAVLFLAGYLHEHALIPGLLLGCALWLLLLIAVIDAQTGLIPDVLSVPLLLLGITLQVVTGRGDVLGILIGAGFFGIQWMVSRGRWVGSGDILLGGGIGALLGSWQQSVLFLFFSYIAGAVIAVGLLASGRKTMRDALPFGPILALGCLLTLLLGQVLQPYFVLL